MSVLSGKKILLGVTGGIAAYKTAFLIRLFIKAGAEVKVVMTENAKAFVTPLTLATLSKNPVITSFTSEEDEGLWNNHVALALWADIMVIAPATANTLAKMASGQSDNFLLATYLSAKSPVYFAPAMDLDMYRHPSTKQTFEQLQLNGNIMIPSGTGELASGLIGEGRMAEPEDILKFIAQDFLSKLPLYGKKVLITAGPTYEAIDPVRFIGNHSSGKMGFALAKTAAGLGAEVILISGPTHLSITHSFIKVHSVVSAQQMYDKVHEFYAEVDLAILSAAVADYRPVTVAHQKIKKTATALHIDLEPTQDILASLGAIKEKQYLVGFALETNDELENAIGKLQKKNLDAIVLNSLNDKGAGFGKSTNKVTFITKDLKITEIPLQEKQEVAHDIFSQLLLQMGL